MVSFFDIIIPTHGRPYLLKRAVKSIRRQQFEDVRLIIISDDPQSQALDSIKSLLKPHDLFIQRFNATGPAASRNVGMKHISAQFVLFLDDDDTYYLGFLSDLYTALQSASGDVFVVDFDVAREYRDDDYADIYKFERWYPSFESMDFKQIYVKNFIPNNVVVYRANTLKNRFFNEKIGYEDWEFLLSVFNDHELVYLPVRGVVVHKMDYDASDSRGAKTRANIAETAVFIYRKYPVVDSNLLNQRKALFEQIGLDYDEMVVNVKNNKFGVNSLRVISNDSLSIMDVFNHGNLILKQESIEAAINYLELWLENNNYTVGSYVIFHQLGYLYFTTHAFKKSLNYFNQAIENSPKFHLSRIFLVDVLLKLNKTDEALQHLAFLLEHNNNVEKENKALFDEAGRLFLQQITRQEPIEKKIEWS